MGYERCESAGEAGEEVTVALLFLVERRYANDEIPRYVLQRYSGLIRCYISLFPLKALLNAFICHDVGAFGYPNLPHIGECRGAREESGSLIHTY